jgi:hypothetical protein
MSYSFDKSFRTKASAVAAIKSDTGNLPETIKVVLIENVKNFGDDLDNRFINVVAHGHQCNAGSGYDNGNAVIKVEARAFG